MTSDDCENSMHEVSVSTETRTISGDGTSNTYEMVRGGHMIDKSIWDAALASADDALVFVQWLESKRDF